LKLTVNLTESFKRKYYNLYNSSWRNTVTMSGVFSTYMYYNTILSRARLKVTIEDYFILVCMMIMAETVWIWSLKT